MSELKDLENYIEQTTDKVSTAAVEATKEQVDLEAKDYFDFLKRNTPKGKTNQLVDSLTKTKINTQLEYGYKIEYVGNRTDGTPNEKVANVLNRGTPLIAGRFFRTRAIRRLKGMDGRIYLRYQEKIKKEQ